jgi:hypothetical protein
LNAIQVYGKGSSLKFSNKINSAEDRYQFVTDWYVKTEKVFSFLSGNKLDSLLQKWF